ncbi:MAG: redoxin domain-containing protein [Bacteroidales bacterium]|nr:redoxin domain-containing protein [Bacteroidales bacterium]
MKFIKIALICIFIVAWLPLKINGQAGYNIHISAKTASATTIRLAYHVGNQQYVRDSLITDKGGKAGFSGEESLPEGVYMIVLPDNRFFEFLVGEDQHFEIQFDKSDPLSTLSFSGSEENTRFLAYQKRWKALQEEAMSISKRLNGLEEGSPEAIRIRKELTAQETAMKQFLRQTAEANRGTLLGAIARSVIPVETPEPELPPGTHNADSVRRLLSYISYKDHFFDNIDFNEPGLIRSPVLGGRMEQFFKQVVIQMPDSVISEADRLLARSSVNDDVFQYVAVWIMNRYASSEIMGHDAVVVHMADKVYLAGRAPWASKEYLADLEKRVSRLRHNLIGMKASELLMGSFAGYHVSLYDIEAEFTIVYFWEPDCGHCKEATPMLKEYYDRNKSAGVEIFAVCTNHDKEKWEKYIIDHGLTWINGWDPQRMSRFDYFYNVESTPLIYILDRNKKIIAKRLAVEDVETFIDSYRKYRTY